MSSDSTKKTIFVALGVCFVCSVLVSTTAVSLNSIQKNNQKREKLKNILAAGDLLQKETTIEKTYQTNIDPVVIDIGSGKLLREDGVPPDLNIQNFDLKDVSKDPRLSETIPPDEDIANIKRRPKYMVVYRVMEGDSVSKYILPIYGKGLWSTMYGFIALDDDLRTIRGFTFYDHGETPGLGGEVDNPKWKQTWEGKMAFDQNRQLRIQVLKGSVDPSDPNSKFKVDGLSGSTLTTRGVDQLVRYWLGENGYGPFFDYLREEKS
ncbi:Na(+)-translocating NADH-quinone reductase subunit C [candidate division KSB1 bacterium]|nr:Na(+)-translocating NADH-quinone reductase subunit C [candidate division KSB1 bacterium]